MAGVVKVCHGGFGVGCEGRGTMYVSHSLVHYLNLDPVTHRGKLDKSRAKLIAQYCSVIAQCIVHAIK